MTADEALQISVANGLTKPGSVGAWEDRVGHIPGAPDNVSLNEVIAAMGRATAASDARSYWTDWFPRGSMIDYAGMTKPLWALSSTIPGIGPVKILTMVDDDKTQMLMGLAVDGAPPPTAG